MFVVDPFPLEVCPLVLALPVEEEPLVLVQQRSAHVGTSACTPSSLYVKLYVITLLTRGTEGK